VNCIECDKPLAVKQIASRRGTLKRNPKASGPYCGQACRHARKRGGPPPVRVSDSFTPDQACTLAALVEGVLAGRDMRIVVRSKQFAEVARKVQSMRERARR